MKEKLSTREKNKRIGAELGWEFCERSRLRRGVQLPWTIPHCRHPQHTRNVWRRLGRLPDFTTDLNAMHEAMRALTDSERISFKVHLIRLWKESYNNRYGMIPSYDDAVNATADQRAEAFAFIRNLWEVGQ